MTTRAPAGISKPRRSWKTPFSPLDEDRLGVQVPRRLVARHDAAHRRRDHDVHLPEPRLDLRGQGLAQALRARRILEDEHLLQEDGGVQARREDEMPFQQGAGGAELVEDVVLGHGLRVRDGGVFWQLRKGAAREGASPLSPLEMA
jgi:hypothetical protein